MDKVVIIGAGLSGATLARFFAESGSEVIVVDKRYTVGGTVYDYTDRTGITVQAFGPHVFHSNDQKVFEFLSLFTKWKEHRHLKRAYLRSDKLIPLPFNLTSLRKTFAPKKAEKIEKILVEEYGLGARIDVNELRKSQNRDVKEFAEYVYKNVFQIYAMKKWGVKPEKLDQDIVSRFPVVLTEDDGAFNEKYQAVPLKGYTEMVMNILRHPKIKLKLGTQASSVISFGDNKVALFDKEFDGIVIYTGSIDELFNYKHGALDFRSTKFKVETVKKASYQEVEVVNYTVSHPYTRVTEFTKFVSDPQDVSVIMKEYPKAFKRGKNSRLYPIRTEKNVSLHEKYIDEVKNYKNLYFTGRLANYKYMNMDEAVRSAMNLYEEITGLEADPKDVNVLTLD